MYGPYLTIAEINAKYPNSLVLIGNPTKSRYALTGGVVILHATDRVEFDRKVEEWPDDPAVRHFATWYTGEIESQWEIFPPDAPPESGVA